MLTIETNKKDYLKKIWGLRWDKWEKKYSILSDKNALFYFAKKQNKFTMEGKEARKFQMGSYIKYLDQYCRFNKCTPTDLLKEINVNDRDKRLQNYLVNFLLNEATSLKELKKLGFQKKPSVVSIKNQIQGKIKGFYSSSGLNISFSIETEKSGKKEEVYLDRETIKIIQNKLESFSFRLINKLETQLGLRINDILIELVKKIDGKSKYTIKKYKNHYYIKNFRTHKGNIIINYLFFSKELKILIKSEYPNQDLTQIELFKLIKSRKMPKRIRDENNKWIYVLDEKGDKMYSKNTTSYDNYRKRLNSIGKSLKFTKNLTNQAFRIFFETKLNTLQDDRFKMQIMGIKPYYTDTIYDQNLKNIEWYYKKWLEVEKVVAIDTEIIDNTSEEMKEIRIQNLELKKELKTQKEQIESMKKKLNFLLNTTKKLPEPKNNNRKICAICREVFKPKSWNQKYCSKKCSNKGSK